jgi:hypothetical protein
VHCGNLTPLILARIQVPQPRNLPISAHIFGFGNRWNSHGISAGSGLGRTEVRLRTGSANLAEFGTDFDQWFEVGVAGAPSPPAWKQNMIVLLMFYPVVFLITAWLEHPFLVGQLKLLHWSALFVDNVISVLLLSVVVLWRAGA